MDGAPYLRKVDLKTYCNYVELSSALEKMFSCFPIGQCGSHGLLWRDGLTESHLMDILHGSKYMLTYEDKNGNKWMFHFSSSPSSLLKIDFQKFDFQVVFFYSLTFSLFYSLLLFHFIILFYFIFYFLFPFFFLNNLKVNKIPF